MTLLITLTVADIDTGPFNLYSNIDDYTDIFASFIDKNVLLAGYTSTDVPDGTTSIKVKSVNELCTNFIILTVDATTSTTTTTTTSLPSILICEQEWTLYNLDVTTYSDGTPIPNVTGNLDWRNLTTGAWCYYDNSTFYKNTYGKLYNWYAVAGIYDAASLANPALRKTLAPDGYHIPTEAEWNILENCLLGSFIAGGKMKSTGTLYWVYPNVGATNSSGFTGLPGGKRGLYGSGASTGVFTAEGNQAFWWSSDENTSIELNTQNDNTYTTVNPEYMGMSVRLIKD